MSVPAEPIETSSRPFNSGRWVVLGMFVFGITATLVMWGYWKLHLAPFYPLQQALADEFKGSLPRVEGGRNKQSPTTLRIVLQVKFTPQETDPRAEAMLDRTLVLARQYQNLDEYEFLE